MAGCVPPTCTSFSSAYQPVNFLQTISENPERSFSVHDSHQKRPLKRKHCHIQNDGSNEGASPSKRFISEEEMTNSIQQLNITTNNPPPIITSTTPLKTTRQLNIKAVSSCQSSLQHKRGRRLSDSSHDISPLHKRACLSKKRTDTDNSTVSVAECDRSKSKRLDADHVTSHFDHVTHYKSHVIPNATKPRTQEENKNNCRDNQSQQASYAVPVISSRVYNINSTSPSSLQPAAPTTLLTTGYYYCPVRGAQTPDIDNTHSPSTSLTDHHYSGGDGEGIISNTRDYPSTGSPTPLQDNGDEDVLMSETPSGNSLLEGETFNDCSTLGSRSSLSLSDVLRKMGSNATTIEDVSLDSDRGTVGPERPLSVWLAPELQQTLAKKNQTDLSVLPPSILEKVTKPKGMELVLWVEPEKLVKAHENNEDDIVDMSEQDTAAEESGTLQNMESVGEHQDYDEDESEMESE